MTLTLLLVLFIAVYHRVQFTLPVPMHPSTIFHITCTYHSEKWGDTDKKKASKALSLFNKVRQTLNMWVPTPHPSLSSLTSRLFYITHFSCVLYFVSTVHPCYMINCFEFSLKFLWNSCIVYLKYIQVKV